MHIILLHNNMCVCASAQMKAKEAGLWNLFLPAVSGLSQLDYAYIAEETGRCLFAPEVFNCQAPGKTSYMMSDWRSMGNLMGTVSQLYDYTYNMTLHFMYTTLLSS